MECNLQFVTNMADILKIHFFDFAVRIHKEIFNKVVEFYFVANCEVFLPQSMSPLATMPESQIPFFNGSRAIYTALSHYL